MWQMGSLALVGSPKVQQKVSILDWKSARSPRVTRSTLASEANAMDEAVDTDALALQTPPAVPEILDVLSASCSVQTASHWFRPTCRRPRSGR